MYACRGLQKGGASRENIAPLTKILCTRLYTSTCVVMNNSFSFTGLTAHKFLFHQIRGFPIEMTAKYIIWKDIIYSIE